MLDLNRTEDVRHAIELLYFGYRAFTSGPDRILQRRGLNRVHHRILYFIGRNPGHSVNDLLRVLNISKQALNIPLRQLVNMNLVANAKSRTDGRVRELRLTPGGRKLESALTGSQVRQLRTVFDHAGADAEKGWRRVMQGLAADE